MTEAEWLACDDPQPMLVFLRGIASDRKFRLFACACCRCIWHLIGPAHRPVVEVAERYADRLASEDELHAAWEQGHISLTVRGLESRHWGDFAATTTALNKYKGRSWWSRAASAAERARTAGKAEGIIQAALLRETVGLVPFRPVALDPDLRTPTVLSLAQAAYDERHLPSGELDAERLLVLADALEDAGCTDATILAHLRSPGPHVRGCWPLDLLLSRE
jgi:hypothetical protein